MSPLKLTVCGAAGRMGAALIKAISENPETELICALERSGSDQLGLDSGQIAGIGENGVSISDDIDAAIDASDGLIDFTIPAASIELAKRLSDKACFQVIGTTGFTAEEEMELQKASSTATILRSGNMSLGVNLLAALVEKAAASLSASDFDIEVLEMHHKHKIDAPSGTALLLGEAAAKGRNIDLAENSVRSRDGITGARDEGTIGFATLRGGAVIGDHSVIFAGESERIELGHFAQDRSLFARGAVKAATWVSGKPHGLYSMRDVLGL